MVTGDWSSSSAYEKDIGWNTFLDNASLAQFTTIHKQSICPVYMLAHPFPCKRTQISEEPRVSVFGADKSADLIRNSVCGLYWMDHTLLSLDSWLLYFWFFSAMFGCHVYVSVSHLHTGWMKNRQVDFSLSHNLPQSYPHISAFSMLPPQQQSWPVSLSSSHPSVGP